MINNNQINLQQRSLEVLEWNGITSLLSQNCATDKGRALASSIESLSAADVKIQIKKISSIKDLLHLGRTISFDGITDIEKLIIHSVKGAVLTIEEIISVKNFITGSEKIRRFLKEESAEYPVLIEEYKQLIKLDDIGKLLNESLTDTGELSERKYPQLKKIRDEIFSSRKSIESKISALINSPAMENIIQEKTSAIRGGRYVILIKAGMKSKIRGTVHDISSSGQTLYFEPEEISGLNSSLVSVEGDLRIETYKILTEISGRIGENSEPLLSNIEKIAYIDFLNSSARVSSKLKLSEPEISDAPVMNLINARHPLLYMMNPDTVISNNIELGKNFNCLLISGANTGGKTVLLKTVGLCALMAARGLHIPAGNDSSIGLFTKIFADIGDDQNIAQSLSTFSGQILFLNETIRLADKNTLVLIDEIITGTNPRQGAAISQAALEELINTECRMIVTTHYSELKDLPTGDARFQNASVSFDSENLKPTYMLKTGMPGVSYALEIAGKYGLSDKVISRSRELLDEREISSEALIEKIQKHEQQLAFKEDEISAMKSKLQTELDEAMERNIRLKKRMEEVMRGEGIDFLDKLSAYKKTIADKISSLQKAGQPEAMKLSAEISGMKDEITSNLEKARQEIHGFDYIQADASVLKTGDKVFIPQIETEGKIETIESDGETAQIILGGSIKARFKISNLYVKLHIDKSQKSRSDKKHVKLQSPVTEETIPLTIQTSFNTIDLRGKRVEEGISIMESKLDSMMRSGINTVIIIHGHGTGAMKEAVRSNLRSSYYAESFRRGEMQEGGDGVTVVSVSV